MAYSVGKPDIVLGSENDILGTMIANSMGCKQGFFRREYQPDGAPAPRIDLNYTITDYAEFKGKKVLTVYRRRQLPDRDSVARHLENYPRLVFNLLDEELFNAGEVDVLYPYWICGRADHNPKTDDDPAVKIKDKGRGREYIYDAVKFKAAGASRILTFHPHFHREPGIIDVGGIEVMCLDAVPSMVRYAKEQLGISRDCLVVNPDLKPAEVGKYCIALEFAKYADLDCSHLEAKRISADAKDAKTVIDAEGRDILMVDDIGSTLSTAKGATHNITNTKRIDIVWVHAVLPHQGHSVANELISSDDYPVRTISATHTVESDFSVIPIHDTITNFYKEAG